MKRCTILIAYVLILSCALCGSLESKAQTSRFEYHDITIGDAGNESMARVPFDFYWQNSLYETIFFASELEGYAGRITQLTIYPHSISYPNGKPVRIWLGHTNQGHLNQGWIPSTDLSLVYDGPLNFAGSPPTMTLALQTPFEYNGTSNLVMMAERSMDTAYYSMGDQFYSKTDVLTRARIIYSDTSVINPASPPTGSTLIYIIPKITFRFTSLYSGKVSGNVSTNTGTAIAGVLVSLNNGAESVTTDANGFYQFNGLNPGAYVIRFEKTGFYPHEQSFDLAIDEELILTEILYPLPLITLSGMVQNSDGEPIAGAVFSLGGYASYEEATDEEGHFLIPDIYGDASYTYLVTAPGYAVVSGSINTTDTDYSMGIITLGGFAFPPQNVIAQEIPDQYQVLLTWQPPSGSGSNLQGYQVWRVPVQHIEHPYAWDLVTPQTITEPSVIDEDWNHIPNDEYLWAVKAIYTDDLISDAVFSNTLQNNSPIAYLAGSVKRVTTQGIAGATISVANTSAITNHAGAYTMIVPVGTYSVTASAPGFISQTVEGVTFNQNMMTSQHFVLEVDPSDAVDHAAPPLRTGLQSVYPNPFNPRTIISYSLQKAAHVRLEVYNLRGQIVCCLVNQPLSAGLHSVSFDARGLSSGVYLLRMQAGANQSSRKMLLMK